ncbi:MAG: response regulator [Gammaproteobacteria bacterium]|nr:response regulator [Gammaproteobacteria bacterium]
MTSLLIVDDSATSRLLFKAHLPKNAEYDIHEAGDAETGLNMAIELQPDLIVLDYNMPDKNGVELAEAMQAAGINGKYALLTANTQKSVVDAANELGFVAVVDKPITAEGIRALLDQVS